MARTPPSAYLESASGWWNNSGSNSDFVPESKQKKGYNVGEAPAAQHLNDIVRNISQWNKAAARAMGGRMALRNIEYAAANLDAASYTQEGFHLDYDSLSDKWYACGVETSAGLVCTWDSADGETWTGVTYPATVGAGSYGDASKIVTNGTVCAIAADNGTQARVYTSSDLTVANLDTGTNVGTSTTAVESSDLVYDDGNNLWIWAGRSTTTSRIFTATTPTGTWTSRLTGAGTDMVALATDGAGTSVALSGGTIQAYYSTNGTTWNTSASSPAASNNIVWSEALQLFIALENASGDIWTSEDGNNWSDQNAVNSVPPVRNLVHGEDYVIGFGVEAASSNGKNYCDLYIFTTDAKDRSSFNYDVFGHVWEDAGIAFDATLGVYRGGQGKIVFPHGVPSGAGVDLAVARYGLGK